MAKQILNEEFRRMQLLAGVITENEYKKELKETSLSSEEEKIFNDIGMENFIDFYNKRGLIDLYPLYFRSFNMLLEANGLSPNITLKEYYDYCGIDLYFITTEVNHFNKVVLSPKTEYPPAPNKAPDWQ